MIHGGWWLGGGPYLWQATVVGGGVGIPWLAFGKLERGVHSGWQGDLVKKIASPGKFSTRNVVLTRVGVRKKFQLKC